MLLVSDLGQFDFAGGQMRLTDVHPRHTVESVQAKTGFVLDVATDLAETTQPSPEELRVLRTEVDPLGIRRLEFLGGSERRELLAAILSSESELADPP